MRGDITTGIRKSFEAFRHQVGMLESPRVVVAPLSRSVRSSLAELIGDISIQCQRFSLNAVLLYPMHFDSVQMLIDQFFKLPEIDRFLQDLVAAHFTGPILVEISECGQRYDRNIRELCMIADRFC